MRNGNPRVAPVRRLLVGAAAAVAGVALLAASDRPVLVTQSTPAAPSTPSSQTAPAPAPSQFRGGVDRVAVDAIIVDADGTPIRDLTLDDFTVAVDGKPRRLQSAELIAFDRPSGTDAPETQHALPEITTNARGTPSRLVLLVIDRESMKASDSKPIMQAGVAFVRQLNASDRVGLLTMPGGPRIDFTRDHQRVGDALGTIMGDAPERGELPPRVSIREAYDLDRRAPGVFATIYERECRRLRAEAENDPCADEIGRKAKQLLLTVPAIAHAKLQTLETLIDAFSHVEGPKVVVLLSQGIAYGDFLPSQVPDIGKAAARAAISFYAIQPFRSTIEVTEAGRPPDLEADRRMLTDGLSSIASVSGGALLQPAGKVDAAFQQIARELSARYALSFDVEPQDQDGKAHRIDLRMTRGNTRLLRYRREFTWRAASPPAATAGDTQAALAALIGSGELRNELSVQITTFTMPQIQAPGQKTTLWAHIKGAQSAAVRLEVFNEQDVRVVAGTKAIEAASVGAAQAGELDYMMAMALPPGRYVARLATQEAAGRAGSVEHPFEARVSGTNDLRVGSMMLLDEQSIADGHPTPLRNVGDAKAFHAYIELQAASASAWSTITGTLEIVDGSDGHVRATMPLSLRETADPARRIAEAVVPLDGWGAGTYLTRAAITHGSAAIATVTRTLVLDAAHAGAPPSGPTGPTGPATSVPSATSVKSSGGGEEAVSAASAYVRQYVDRSTSVVAEERYVQIMRPGPADPKRRDVDEALEWRDDNWIHGRSFKDAKLRRQLISDVLMVRTKDEMWTNFRDVGNVDGREIQDRSKRALALFAKGGVDVGATLRRIADESSRHDLGRIGNINAPSLPLQVLLPAHKDRFDFASEGTETIDGTATVVLAYQERGRPTFIRNRQKNEPVFISGKLWIVPGDGRIVRTEMTAHDELSRLTSNMIVSYRLVPELGMLMPVEMWERYTPDRPLADYIERRARYSNFRRFTVSVSETPAK
jgi:VWFA-related protein